MLIEIFIVHSAVTYNDDTVTLKLDGVFPTLKEAEMRRDAIYRAHRDENGNLYSATKNLEVRLQKRRIQTDYCSEVEPIWRATVRVEHVYEFEVDSSDAEIKLNSESEAEEYFLEQANCGEYNERINDFTITDSDITVDYIEEVEE